MKDHTKSLIRYQKILLGFEEQYCKISTDRCGDVIEEIAQHISEAAVEEGAEIADGDGLKKVSILFSFDTCLAKLWIPANH